MARLYVLAEGQTEQTFASQILAPHLAPLGVYLAKPILVAHAKRAGKVHRGGLFKYKPFRDDLGRLLRQEKATDCFFTTMIDFYALPQDFPGQSVSINPVSEKVAHLTRCLAEDVQDSRFLPFLQLHEFEAYLLSAPEAFLKYYSARATEVGRLVEIVKSCGGPESVNDGPTTAPSKRILELFPDYEKAVLGPLLAEEIGLATIRRECPHFDAWLRQLEGLAG